MAAGMDGAMSIWQSGLPLLEAAETHAPKQLLRKLSNTRPPENPKILPGIEMLAAGMDEPQKDRFIKSAKDVSGAWSAMRAQATIISEIRGALRKKVSIGALVAYGYEAACPKTPTMIPPYLFEHDKFIDWQNSTVKGNGLQYLSVRVVAPPMQPAPAALIRTRVTGTVPKKIGRPSSKNRASEAIWILLKENPEFSALLQKQKIQMVREFILRTYSDEFPGGKGLSDKTLGIHISRFSSRSSD